MDPIGVHPCLVDLVPVVADPEIDQDRLVLLDLLEARPNGEGRGQAQSSHRGIGLADDAAGAPAQDMPCISLIIKGADPEQPLVAQGFGICLHIAADLDLRSAFVEKFRDLCIDLPADLGSLFHDRDLER